MGLETQIQQSVKDACYVWRFTCLPADVEWLLQFQHHGQRAIGSGRSVEQSLHKLACFSCSKLLPLLPVWSRKVCLLACLLCHELYSLVSRSETDIWGFLVSIQASCSTIIELIISILQKQPCWQLEAMGSPFVSNCNGSLNKPSAASGLYHSFIIC